ncbi:MAG: hypothetical protein HONBIEJF_02708 [Fimbriimonadaceae bacterium]|nr:hypothetical protein [Fimbriimonadaceae bacterium]
MTHKPFAGLFVKTPTGQASEFRPLPVSQVSLAIAKKAA